ncbi:hypothetical protein FACHB389_03315 [Nostoc calcicola FACHB-389]|nr:hypothetical protein FACHB389_03315 [Nostoc calcicola FACHB-389]
MGSREWGDGEDEGDEGDEGDYKKASHTSPTPQSPLPTPKFLNKFFQAPKQFLEKSHMSPTIEIAETHVSVHSSHHTPPGLLFGRFLMFMNKFSSFFANVHPLL